MIYDQAVSTLEPWISL